jgi:hypothetical protein
MFVQTCLDQNFTQKGKGLFGSTKTKVWERYGKVWAIYDPYVGMIWDSIDNIWDWYGV